MGRDLGGSSLHHIKSQPCIEKDCLWDSDLCLGMGAHYKCININSVQVATGPRTKLRRTSEHNHELSFVWRPSD